MQTNLGRTGMRVNRMGFGGIPIQRLSLQESDRVIASAVDVGINFFDTARVYSDSEEKLGRVLAQHRTQVYIASKTLARSGKETENDLHTSLERLRTDYIDLYICHNVGSEEQLSRILAEGSTLDTMRNARNQGKIRYIGVSGHKPWVLLQAIKQYPFDALQAPLNYIETASLENLIPYARERGIGTIAMKPVAGGALTAVDKNFRFILNNGIDVAIPGMDSVKQVLENVSILKNLAPLSRTEIRQLEQEKSRLGDRFCRRCEYCMPCPEGLPISFLHVLQAYYFRYNLKDWVWERVNALPKAFKDCVQCGQCIEKCPYELNSPDMFQETWSAILADRKR